MELLLEMDHAETTESLKEIGIKKYADKFKIAKQLVVERRKVV